MDSFDPYQIWLGIPSQLRPLNHYVLLGIRLFEDDPEAIHLASESRLKILKELQSGPRGDLSEEVMTEVTKARIELLDTAKKARYDHQLRTHWQNLESQRENKVDSVVLDPVTDSNRSLEDASRNAPVVGNSELESSTSRLQSRRRLPADPEAEDSNGSPADKEDLQDGESLFGLLLDIRVVVAMLSIIVIVMTATVVLFSKNEPPVSVLEPDHGVPSLSGQESRETDSNENQSAPDTNSNVSTKSIATIQQAADGSFNLPSKLAELSRPELVSDSNGIIKWQPDDQAEWTLAVSDRRRGYFYCEVTYQAKSESQFSVQLGQLAPRTFTLYPHREDFTEQFIVRLDKLDVQSLKLMAKQVESIAEIQIKRVKLVPR